jgi:hypothetical protein
LGGGDLRARRGFARGAVDIRVHLVGKPSRRFECAPPELARLVHPRGVTALRAFIVVAPVDVERPVALSKGQGQRSNVEALTRGRLEVVGGIVLG